MDLNGFPFCPSAENLRPLSLRHKFELVGGPRAFFRCYVVVRSSPHLGPKHSQKRRDFVVTVQFPQEEEVIIIRFLEKSPRKATAYNNYLPSRAKIVPLAMPGSNGIHFLSEMDTS